MQHICWNDSFTLTTAKSDINHTILAVDLGSNNFGTTAVAATSVTQSDATNCASFKQFYLEYYNPTTKIWVDYFSMSSSDKTSLLPFV